MDHNMYFASNLNLSRRPRETNDDCEISETHGIKTTDELLIDCVRSYPHLYNHRDKNFKNKLMKDNSWAEIGKTLMRTPEQCLSDWTRLRDRFSKEKRLLDTESRSGSGASSRKKFDLYEHMLFMEPHIKSRHQYSNAPGGKSGQTTIMRGKRPASTTTAPVPVAADSADSADSQDSAELLSSLQHHSKDRLQSLTSDDDFEFDGTENIAFRTKHSSPSGFDDTSTDSRSTPSPFPKILPPSPLPSAIISSPSAAKKNKLTEKFENAFVTLTTQYSTVKSRETPPSTPKYSPDILTFGDMVMCEMARLPLDKRTDFTSMLMEAILNFRKC